MDELPPDITDLKFKHVSVSTFVDVDHAHDIETSWYVPVMLIILNRTTIQYYIKRHNSIDTLKHASELISIIIYTDLTMAMHYNLIIIEFTIDNPD